jgi:hypothetical protein
MFGKLGKRWASHYSKAKGHMTYAYGQAKHIAHAIDQGVDLVSRVHQAVQPALQQSQYGRTASKAITSGFEGYAHEKSKVLGKHREIEEATGRVRQFAPELSGLF